MRKYLQRALFAGLAVWVCSLAHVPARILALNSFDPPKRLVWAGVALLAACCWRGRVSRGSGQVWLAGALLAAWMLGRTLLKAGFPAEVEVLFTWLLPLILFLLAAACALPEGRSRVLGYCLLAAGVVQAVIMMLQRFGVDPFFAETTRLMPYAPARMLGTVGYQNQAAEFLALSMAGFFMIPWRHRKSAAPVLLIIFTAILLTANRGALLGCLGAGIAAAFAYRRHMPEGKSRLSTGARVGACLLGGVLLACFFVPELSGRLKALVLFREHAATASRMWMWKVAAEMICEQPLLGWGAGEYAFQYLVRLGNLLPLEKGHALLQGLVYAREAHNDFLQFTVEFGFIGLLLLLAGFAGIGRLIFQYRNVLRVEDGERPDVWVVYVLVFMAVASAFSFSWQTSLGGPLAGLLLGWGVACMADVVRHPECNLKRPAHDRIRICAQAGMIGMTGILFVWFAWSTWMNQALAHSIHYGTPDSIKRMLPGFVGRPWALWGAAIAEQGRSREACDVLLDVRMRYLEPALWNNLGNVLAAEGRWAEAHAVYEEWAKSGILYFDALSNLSIAKEQLGDLHGAHHFLAVRMSLWPEPTPKDVGRLAVLRMKSGDAEKAYHGIWRFYRFWRDEGAETLAEMENLSGAACMMMQDYEQAETHFSRALSHQPALSSARRNLAAIHHMRESPQGDLPRIGK